MTDTPAPTTAQKLGAEAIGTFVLVLFGVGSATIPAVVLSSELSELGGIATFFTLAAVGLSFGIAILAMVYAFGRVSGGHFNPAVSIGAALGGRIAWKEAGSYVGAQIGGALVGGLLLVLIILLGTDGPSFGDDAFGANYFGDRGGFDLGGALIIEIVMTFILVMVILAVTDTRNEHPAMAPLAIGLSVAAIHFATIAATGTSINPARSLSTVFFSGGDAIAQIWLFILAPIVGGAIAGFVYPALFGHGTEPVTGSGLKLGGSSPAAVPGYGAPDAYQQQWNQQVGGYPQGQQGVGAPWQPQPAGQQGGQQGGQQSAWPDPAAGATQAPGFGQQQPAAQQSAQQPAAQQSAQPAPQQPQKIVQDGWEWDPVAQQWIPEQQSAPQGWPDAGGERTQVRPPDGQ